MMPLLRLLANELVRREVTGIFNQIPAFFLTSMRFCKTSSRHKSKYVFLRRQYKFFYARKKEKTKDRKKVI